MVNMLDGEGCQPLFNVEFFRNTYCDTQHATNMLEEAWTNTIIHNNAVCFQVDGGGENGSNILQQLGLNRALSVFTCNGGKAIQTLNRIQYTPEVEYISWTKKIYEKQSLR